MSHDEKLSALTRQLLQKKIMLACAESCTGGLISERLTLLPGSSAWFDCGVVTYSNHAKEQLLHVPSSLIQTHGAVSGEVALAMAVGLLAQTQASIGLSVTGIAGPDGGTIEKPVGTVFMAVAACIFEPLVYAYHFNNHTREMVKWMCYEKALEVLLLACEKF